MDREERNIIIGKVICWAKILDCEEYLMKGDKPDYALINKFINRAGEYKVLEKAFLSLLLSYRIIESKQQFIAAVFDEIKQRRWD